MKSNLAAAIAVENPYVGLMLLNGAVMAPMALTIQFQFSETTINKPVNGTMSTTPGSTATTLSSVFIVEELAYTVERPNWMPGSVLRGQDEYFNSQVPAVNLDVAFNAPVGIPGTLALNITSTPIQNLVPGGHTCCLRPWILWPNQAPTLTGTNTRTFQGAEIPYVVSWTMLGSSVVAPEDVYGACKRRSFEDAQCECLGRIDELRTKVAAGRS